MGRLKEIDNPLFGFDYPDNVRDGSWVYQTKDPVTKEEYPDRRFIVWNQVVRYPKTVKDSKLDPKEPGQPFELQK